MKSCTYNIVFLLLTMAFIPFGLHAQEDGGVVLPTESQFNNPKQRLWINTYGNIRISKRLFWDAQTHFRFTETRATPYVGQIAQIYNRHAIGYIYSKKINFSLGGVLRINFNTNEDELPTDRNVVPEYRIWHQYQFAQPLYTAMIYHRIRIEHRWTRGFAENSSFIFRNRFRYLVRGKIPLNSHKLETNTLYIAPEAEVILQGGKQVVGSIYEDLRLTTTLGYILTPRLTVAGGLMYSQGQTFDNPGIFNQNWTIRLHMYFSPDFRKVRNKLPAIHLND